MKNFKVHSNVIHSRDDAFENFPHFRTHNGDMRNTNNPSHGHIKHLSSNPYTQQIENKTTNDASEKFSMTIGGGTTVL